MSGAEQVVEFVIGDELFAVDLFDTREVITTPEVTPLPNAPPFITGMIDLRGVITTIIDLRVMMHITRESTGKKRSRVIVLDKTVSEKMIGILVDDVYSVTTYMKSDIDEDAHSSNESHRDILGVIRKHKKDAEGKDKSVLVIWLDIKKMVERVEKDL
jgi:purine-binding chemotaxis protein CheW